MRQRGQVPRAHGVKLQTNALDNKVLGFGLRHRVIDRTLASQCHTDIDHALTLDVTPACRYLVDHPADQPRRAAGLPGRFRPGHADAVPAHRDADLPLGGRFRGHGGPQGSRRHIAGYSYHDFIAYYLLTMISRAFSSMPGLASGIARDIRDGTVKKYLIQPIDMLGFLMLYRLAHKLVYYVRGGGAVRAGVLPVPRLFSRLARRPDAGWPSWPRCCCRSCWGSSWKPRWA